MRVLWASYHNIYDSNINRKSIIFSKNQTKFRLREVLFPRCAHTICTCRLCLWFGNYCIHYALGVHSKTTIRSFNPSRAFFTFVSLMDNVLYVYTARQLITRYTVNSILPNYNAFGRPTNVRHTFADKLILFFFFNRRYRCYYYYSDAYKSIIYSILILIFFPTRTIGITTQSYIIMIHIVQQVCTLCSRRQCYVYYTLLLLLLLLLSYT